MKKNKGSACDQLLSLDAQDYQDISRVITCVKQYDSRDRTLLAMDILRKKPGVETERMLVFFSLGAPVEPVRLTDCVGRKFCFPFEQCRIWGVSFSRPTHGLNLCFWASKLTISAVDETAY